MCFNTLYQFLFIKEKICVVGKKKKSKHKKSHLNEIVRYENLNFMFVSEDVKNKYDSYHVITFAIPITIWISCVRAGNL